MQKMTYVKGPGYVQDLYFAFVLYYNKDIVTEKFAHRNRMITDTKFYRQIVDRFSPFDDDLLPFFYLKNDTICFIASKYQIDMDLIHNFSLDIVLEALKDRDAVVLNMLNFYLDIKFRDSVKDIQDFNRRVRATDYPDNVKYHLVTFFLDPDFYIDKLVSALREKDRLLKRYYKENEAEIPQVQSSVDINELYHTLEATHMDKGLVKNGEGYYTVCLVDVNHALFKHIDGALFAFLGTNYKQVITDHFDSLLTPNMTQLGKIYSEENRIKIIDMLLKSKELCTTEIADRLNLSPTAVYYHLEMMYDSRMLLSRNEGRTIYYSVNRDYFRLAGDAFHSVANNGLEEVK